MNNCAATTLGRCIKKKWELYIKAKFLSTGIQQMVSRLTTKRSGNVSISFKNVEVIVAIAKNIESGFFIREWDQECA